MERDWPQETAGPDTEEAQEEGSSWGAEPESFAGMILVERTGEAFYQASSSSERILKE